MLRKLLAGALALLAMGAVSAASAQVEITLGEETALKLIPDTDRIDTAKIPGRYRGIRIYALDGSAVDISTIDIVYDDGSKYTEDRGKLIRLDQRDVRTRIIGPQGGAGPEKFIDHIILRYKTAPGESRRARVRVTGVTSPAGSRAVRPGAAGAPIAAPARPGGAPANPAGPATGPVAGQPTAPTPNLAPPGTAAGGDVLFGVQSVGFAVDRDVIKVGAELGKFDKIRLRVLDNDLFINEMRVIYANGEPDVLAVAANIPANTRTKWFTLKGDRFIKEIQLVYRARPGYRGQARVEVYGEYSPGWFGHDSAKGGAGQIAYTGEAFTHGGNKGWLYLGGQQPKFFSIKKGIGYETDIVSVARNRGFNRVRLDVLERAITLNRLTIVYGDNTNDVVNVGKAVEAGQSFTVPTLKNKPIKEIQVSYRSRIFDKQATSQGYSFVKFWAQ